MLKAKARRSIGTCCRPRRRSLAVQCDFYLVPDPGTVMDSAAEVQDCVKEGHDSCYNTGHGNVDTQSSFSPQLPLECDGFKNRVESIYKDVAACSVGPLCSFLPQQPLVPGGFKDHPQEGTRTCESSESSANSDYEAAVQSSSDESESPVHACRDFAVCGVCDQRLPLDISAFSASELGQYAEAMARKGSGFIACTVCLVNHVSLK